MLDSETKIQYTIDLTRGYHNLLQKEEAGKTQTYLWDVNVAGMKEEAGNGQNGPANAQTSQYYFQDELGSPIRLTDNEGNLRETYGYDEFGQDLYGNQGEAQPFGYTGYQNDRITGTYYAQAREYRAELGRFAGRDIIKGYTAAPYTLNEYGYCWGNPMILVDMDGAWPKWIKEGWENIKDFWNTHIYGEKVTIKETTGDLNGVISPYHTSETSSTIQSQEHTGSIIVKETIITNGETNVKYSINIPTYDLGGGKSIGIPVSLGASAGSNGINISASVGVDLIAPKISVNANVGLNWKELISAKVNADVGWLTDKVGVGAKLPISPWDSLRLFCYHQGIVNGIKMYDEWGIHMKMGVVYAIVIIVALFYGVASGAYDIQMAIQQFEQYWNSLSTCPFK